jgi:hypothetical protein
MAQMVECLLSKHKAEFKLQHHPTQPKKKKKKKASPSSAGL